MWLMPRCPGTAPSHMALGLIPYSFSENVNRHASGSDCGLYMTFFTMVTVVVALL